MRMVWMCCIGGGLKGVKGRAALSIRRWLGGSAMGGGILRHRPPNYILRTIKQPGCLILMRQPLRQCRQQPRHHLHRHHQVLPRKDLHHLHLRQSQPRRVLHHLHHRRNHHKHERAHQVGVLEKHLP
uniref:Uncharacterized protein n=1 Tax=Opuntia streptacantha TaxID=393608 RepID=A0A7C9DG29_OPUST